jgi:hypothetical protein
MESVIKQTYEIILSCENKYKIHSFKKCMDKHVYNVIKLSMDYVRKYPYNQRKCKDYIMKLVVDSLLECASESYKYHKSYKRIDDMIKCIHANIKDLINVAVDALSLSLQLQAML